MSARARAVGLAARLLPASALVWIRKRRFVGRLAGRALPAGTQVVRILHGPIEGARIEVDLSRDKAFWLGVWEPELAAVLDREAHGVSWDIGANIGYFTLLLARRSNHVLAVEASPEMAARLRRNVGLNDVSVTVVEVAVAGSAGRVRFELSSEGGMSRVAGLGGVAEAPIVGNVQVDATTLDGLLEAYGRPDFVKIDIEGAELAALESATRFLEARPTILCDLHGAEVGARVPELLRGARYDVDFVQPSCVLAHPGEETR